MTIKNLKVGSKDISKMYIGERMSDTVYLGNEKVYENIDGSVIESSNSYRLTADVWEGIEIEGELVTKIAKISGGGTIDGNGHSMCEYTYDNNPTGNIEITRSIPIQQCENFNFKNTTLHITGDRGLCTLNTSNLENCELIIKPNGPSNFNIDATDIMVCFQGNNCTLNLEIANYMYFIMGNNNILNISGGDSMIYISGDNNDLSKSNISNSDVYTYGNTDFSYILETDGNSIDIWRVVTDDESTTPTRPTTPTPPTPEPI